MEKQTITHLPVGPVSVSDRGGPQQAPLAGFPGLFDLAEAFGAQSVSFSQRPSTNLEKSACAAAAARRGAAGQLGGERAAHVPEHADDPFAGTPAVSPEDDDTRAPWIPR
jgi:hypothetical protein